MPVKEVVITHFRNLSRVSFAPNCEMNLIVGPNGSGKTSILEGIYFLGRARSFLTNKSRSFIQHGEKSCTVFGGVDAKNEGLALSIGVSRTLEGMNKIKVAGDYVRTSAPLLELLPIQVINPGAFSLLNGGPSGRRQFTDWGVFHVEHAFLESWRSFSRCLKQRNSLLRKGVNNPKEISPWDDKFVAHAEKVALYRDRYIENFIPHFHQALSEMTDLGGVTISFSKGWDSKKDLVTVLKQSYGRDKSRGFTHAGPQRADLRIRYLGMDASETLSRGQQKMVVCALKIAQSRYFTETTGKAPVYLVDDLAAELDHDHRFKFCQILSDMGSQVFATSINASPFGDFWGKNSRALFHVEQGCLVKE